MKRKIISTVIGVLVAAAAVGTGLIALDTQSDLAPVADSSVVASLPVVSSNPLTVEVMDGLRFKLDTGRTCRVSQPAISTVCAKWA